MDSPISPRVASLYMKAFEKQALNTAPHPPSVWRRFVDDTFVVIQTAHKVRFIEHINSIDDSIQFTIEESRSDGSMLFLDTLVIPQPDGSSKEPLQPSPPVTSMEVTTMWEVGGCPGGLNVGLKALVFNFEELPTLECGYCR